MSKLRDDFLRQAREIEEKYEKKLSDLREEMELRRKTEIHEIEERKNQQINDLLRNHEKAFSDIKNYYNDITLNNLNLINTLKVRSKKHSLLGLRRFFLFQNEIEKKKQEEERLEKRMTELENENRKMREPLEAAKKEMEELRRRAENYEKDKALLAVTNFFFPHPLKFPLRSFVQSTKHRLKTCEADLKTVKWEYEVLLQRFEIVRASIFSDRFERENSFRSDSDPKGTRRSLSQIHQSDQRSSAEEQPEEFVIGEETEHLSR